MAATTGSFPIRKRTVVGATTPAVREEFQQMAMSLRYLKDRKERVEMFENLRQSLTTEAQKVIRYMIDKEDSHKIYVNNLLSKIEGFADRQPHDFSKDPLFCFVMSFHFDCEQKSSEMEFLVQEEFENHYTSEAHHPEWEKMHQRECSTQDILEMAIDRLSRNLQRNDGQLNTKQMEQYLPQFPLGNNEEKQTKYLDFVKQYTSMVQKAYVPNKD